MNKQKTKMASNIEVDGRPFDKEDYIEVEGKKRSQVMIKNFMDLIQTQVLTFVVDKGKKKVLRC